MSESSGKDDGTQEQSDDDVSSGSTAGDMEQARSLPSKSPSSTLAHGGSKKKKKKQASRRVSQGDPNGSYATPSQTTANNSSSLSSSSLPDDDEEECELLGDTFSFLMTAKYPFESCCSNSANNYSNSQNQGVDSDFWCFPFWAGFLVNMGQLFIYSVVIANQFFNGQMPPNADFWLRLAQIFAVLVTLYTQSDFIDGIFLFTEGWKPFRGISTPFKFNVSALLRIFIGNVGIAATFILIIYSTEVVDLLLNFTAMEFVATLDASAFDVASKGFLGITLGAKAAEILAFRYKPRKKRGGAMTRLCMYTLYVCFVFAAFVVVVGLQANRKVGVDNEVYVQFAYPTSENPISFRPELGIPEMEGISGVYRGCQGFRTKETGDIGYIHISYNECPQPTQEKESKFPMNAFVYCWSLDGWVFTSKETSEPCTTGSYLLWSIADDPLAADSFDILRHSGAKWLVRQPDNGNSVLLEYAFIESTNDFFAPFQGCEGGIVPLMEDPYFVETRNGTVRTPLTPLPSGDNEEDYYPNFEGTSYLDAFGMMYRPVYIGETYEEGISQVIIFDGLRWLWLLLNPFEYAKTSKAEADSKGEAFDTCDYDTEECAWKIFVKYFLTYRSWIHEGHVGVPLAASDPMIFLTPEDTVVPTESLTWYSVARSPTSGYVQGRLSDASLQNDLGIPRVIGTSQFGFGCQSDIGEVSCGEDEILLTLEFGTDISPSENILLVWYGRNPAAFASLDTAETLFLSPLKDESFEVSEGFITDFRFEKDSLRHLFHSCVPKEQECVRIAVLDTFRDGIEASGYFEFSYGNETIESGPGCSLLYWSCLSYHFGPGCMQDSVDVCEYIDPVGYHHFAGVHELFQEPSPAAPPALQNGN